MHNLHGSTLMIVINASVLVFFLIIVLIFSQRYDLYFDFYMFLKGLFF